MALQVLSNQSESRLGNGTKYIVSTDQLQRFINMHKNYVVDYHEINIVL